MNWRKVYTYLCLAETKDQPDIDSVSNIMGRMFMGEPWAFELAHDDPDSEDRHFYPEPVHGVPVKIEVVDGQIHLTIKLDGVWPDGVEPGTYTLVMEGLEANYCTSLPPEMFKGGEAPECFVKEWQHDI